ncbi:MAG: hypothetical protein RLZZ57_1037, partial [Pseudomonadota bacterium]
IFLIGVIIMIMIMVVVVIMVMMVVMMAGRVFHLVFPGGAEPGFLSNQIGFLENALFLQQ